MTAEPENVGDADLRTDDEFSAPPPIDLGAALGVNPNADVDPEAAKAALAEVPWEPGSSKPDPILVCENVSRRFGGLLAVDVDHLEVQRGVITALIGPNGAGKTTFFNLLTNFDTPDTGTRVFSPDIIRPEDDHYEVTESDFHYASFDGRFTAELMFAAAVVALALLGVGVALRGVGFSVFGFPVTGLLVFAILALVMIALAVTTAIAASAAQRRRSDEESTLSRGFGNFVVDQRTGRKVSAPRRWLRLLASVGSAVPIYRGFSSALRDPRQQTWHGRWTRTVVVSDLPHPLDRKYPPTNLGRVPSYRVASMGMVRTFQLTKALSRMTCIENMKLGATGQKGESLLASWLPLFWRYQERAIQERADALLQRFRMDHMRDQFAGTLSGGQRKLLEMARALMVQPRLVMLDEPMAGVNPALTQSLLGHITGLRDSGMTVVFVEHDMDMVQSIADWVVVMAEGRIIAEGPPASIAENQAVVDAYLGSSHDSALDLDKEL